MSSAPTTHRQHAPLPRIQRPAWEEATPHGVAFALFLIANACLFIRPSEVVPAVRGLEIYRYFLLACLVAGLPAVLEMFSGDVLERRPTAVCVFGLLLAVFLSHFSHAQIDAAIGEGFEFFKIVVYFVLFLALVTTPGRMRALIACLVIFSLVAALLAILDYHEVIQLYKLPRINAQGEELPAEVISDGEKRMVGTGIFQDPNDLCSLLAMAALLTMYLISEPRWDIFRFLWVGPLFVFVYGIRLTTSRGGLLALLAGVGVFTLLRFGWRRLMLLGVLGLPLLFFLLAGRQTQISSSTGTGQERLQLWSDGLDMFRSSPLFGVGVGEYMKDAGHVAHNSYLHAFAEMGFFGGLFFTGAFYLVLVGLVRLARPVAASSGNFSARLPVILDPDLRRLYPYLTGAVVAWAVGMLSLSLCYLVPTYTILGLATMFLLMARTEPALPPLRFDGTVVGRMAVFGVVYLAGIYVFVRVFRH